MLKLVKAGLYVLLVGTSMDLVYHSAPPSFQDTFNLLFGPGGLYAHIVTGAGIVLSMLVLLPSASNAPQKRPRTKKLHQ